jgi:hypothetical protein
MVDKNVNVHPTNAKKEADLGIRRRVLTLDRIKGFALARLGYPQVDVEIDEFQFGEFWEATLDEYNKWLPIEKSNVITATSSTRNKYDLRALNKPYGRNVVDVRIASKEQFFSPISGVFALGIPHPISHLSPDQYDLALRYIFASKKIYSSEPDWEWEEPILWLYAPTGFGGPFIAAYKYTQDVSRPEDIPQEDWSWVMKYFRTFVKEAVGEARGKFSSIPGKGGQQLRGSEMVSEAIDERGKLEEDIESKSYCRVPPLGPNSVG